MRCDLSRRQLAAGLCLGLGLSFARPRDGQAQPAADRVRRIGVMMAVAETDPESGQRLDAFRRGLAEAGLVEGRGATVEVRWYRGSAELARTLARELLDIGVEVIVVNGTPGLDALRALDVRLPIVFTVVSNPVGAGYVPNLARPGGNITGFSTFEPEIAGKWLQILRQISPGLKHAAMLLDPKFTGFNSLWRAVEEIAPRDGIAVRPAHAGSLEEIERAVEELSKLEAPGLIVSPSPVYTVNRKRLIALANELRLPAIYPFRFYVRDGALVAYGFNATDQFRRAAAYVGRILKGESAGELPVQAPSLFELGLNLQTARAMGITVPQTLLVAADEVVR